MSYIRTKDGRILKFNDKICDPLPCVIGEQIDDNVGIFKGVEVIKQAGTIEELCDGWVVRRHVMDEPCHWFYSSKEQMKADISLRNKAYSIYGAVWVEGEHNEPILKPIAKMNDKGELELL